MAASFIRKSDGNFYLRLTGNTQTVSFGAASNAANIYDFIVDGSIVLSKNQVDNSGSVYYTGLTSGLSPDIDVFPIPNGGTKDNTRFTGETVRRTYSGSGTRDYLLSFNVTGQGNPQFYLGGASLNWGNNLFAYPTGVISNTKAVGVKQAGVWRNAQNIFIKQNGVWRECTNAFVKRNGVWKQIYQNYSNSSWINIIESTDDILDFGVQVYAYN